MYIEFNLSITPSLQAAANADFVIDTALEAWSKKYQIHYKSKRYKDFKRVTFDSDESYSLFAMTWNVDRKFYALSRWRIVSDLNNKIEFDSFN
jgi:hypothetical protein